MRSRRRRGGLLRRLWRLRPQLAQAVLLLALMRLLVSTPLPGRTPDLAPHFRADGFLALLDVFTGGAAARFSVAALGFLPFLLAHFLVPPARGVVSRLGGWFEFAREIDSLLDRKDNVTLLRYALTALASALMGAGYLLLLQRLGVRLSVDWLSVTAMSAGTMLLVWLASAGGGGNPFFNLNLALAANAAAAIPGYLFDGRSSVWAFGLWLAACLLAVYGYAFLSGARRNLPVALPKRYPPGSHSPQHHSVLPLTPMPGLAPVFLLLIALGGLRLGASFLLQARTAWVSRLAGLERALTDPAEFPFWLVVLAAGALMMAAFGRARLWAQNPADDMQRSGVFIPGIRPGRLTHQYLDTVVMRLAPVSALAAMTLMTAPAFLALALGAGGPRLMMIFPALYALGPIHDAWRTVEAQESLRDYGAASLFR